ncbi:MAG: hypothetical protein GY884_02540 [Proteobacteria bacterium]|nr:hypothetical protein [Pseudomonadota bacterium]
MPIGDYSTDHGVGFGGVVQAVRRVDGEEGYRLKLGAQLMWSTGTFRDHWLKVNWRPDELWRVEAVAGRRAWRYAPYFGVGNAAVESGVPREFHTYEIDGARALVSVKRSLGGDWAVFGTGFLRTARITPNADSLLVTDGVASGRYVSLAIGVVQDSRNDLLSPTDGRHSELSVRGSNPLTSSQTIGGGLNLTERVYVPVRPRLVLATRASIDVWWGDTPFFVQHVLGGSQWATLGGPWVLRGYPEGRFRGDAAGLFSQEWRWSVAEVGVRGHRLTLMPTPFYELARIESWSEDEPYRVWGDVGFGARFGWDDDMLLRIDTAVGREVTTTGAEPSLGIWFMFDHPF